MTTAPLPPDLRAAAPPIAGRFSVIIAGLAGLVAHAFLKHPRRAVIVLPLWIYINRLSHRFAALMAHLAAGRITRARPSRAGAPRRERPTTRPRLPQGQDWLGHDLGWQGRGFASQLDHLLNTPEAADLVARSPQAQRLLRPLCRMLGLAIPAIPPLPPRVRKPRPRPAPKPKRLTRKQREAILWYPNFEGKPMKLLPPRKFRA